MPGRCRSACWASSSGVPEDDLEQLHRWGQDWLLVQNDLPLERRIAHARGTVELQRYFVRAVESRLERPSDDLMGALVAANAELDPPLPVVDVAGLPLDLIVAGHVTVTRAIGSALHVLFRHPPFGDRLRDPTLAAAAIEELLRLESPAQGLFRVTTREVELGGVTLPADARVMAHFASANRDECRFADAAAFDPERADLARTSRSARGSTSASGRRSRDSSSGSRCRCSSTPARTAARRGRAGRA